MSEHVNKSRRNFIKFAGIGGVALIVGKFLGPEILDLLSPKTVKEFDRFKVTESRREFTVSTKDGEEIFIMDNEE